MLIHVHTHTQIGSRSNGTNNKPRYSPVKPDYVVMTFIHELGHPLTKVYKVNARKLYQNPTRVEDSPKPVTPRPKRTQRGKGTPTSPSPKTAVRQLRQELTVVQNYLKDTLNVVAKEKTVAAEATAAATSITNNVVATASATSIAKNVEATTARHPKKRKRKKKKRRNRKRSSSSSSPSTSSSTDSPRFYPINYSRFFFYKRLTLRVYFFFGD